MALDVLLRIRGAVDGVAQAVDEAEAELNTMGDGVDSQAIAGRIGRGLGGALKAVNWIGLAAQAAEWLIAGMDEAMAASPEGEGTQEALDELGTALDELRTTILVPIIPVIKAVATALGIVVRIVAGAAKALSGLIDLAAQVVRDIATELDKLLGPLQDIQSKIEGLIGDIARFLGLAQEANGLGNGLSSPGDFSAPAPAGMRVTVNTGADPTAVIRAVRTYGRWHGGRASFDRQLRRG